MDKSDYAGKWKAAKQEYEQDVGQKKPTEKVLKVFTLTKSKGTGIEKALSDFDNAINSKNRKDAATAYQSAWKACGAYSTFLGHAAIDLQQADPTNPVVMSIQMLIAHMNRITGAMPATLKELQELKGEALKVHAFQADFEGELNTYKKAVNASKDGAKVDKKHKIATLAEPCVKYLKAYSVAAGRADAAKAKKALDDYAGASSFLEGNCNQALAESGPIGALKAYTDALKQFMSLARSMRNVRVKNERDILAGVIAQQG